ncbi:hypothetical protein Tco_0017472 [Tanacetum coccineum]
MIGCKLTRTLASVEIEIILVLGFPCYLSSTSMRCLENVVVHVRMSTPVFVEPEIYTQADGAQSSRVPVPLPEDPYEAIRQAYLVGTDTKSEPFEDPIETETPESPHTVASPTSLPDSIPPTCHVEESEGSDTFGSRSTTARMAVRVPPVMSPGLSASIAEVAAMSNSAFHKRFRSSYESSPSLSPSELPSQKRYQGTFELVEDDEEEDEEIEESSDSNSESEDVEDEDPTAEDEDPAAGDEVLAEGDEGPSMGVESIGLGGDEAVPEGQQRAAPVVETAVGKPLRLGYGALRRREIALGEGRMPSVIEVGPSYGSVPESERPERVPTLRQPTLTTWIDPEDAIAYIDVPAYPPPAPPVQTPPSPEWSSGSLPVSPTPSIVPSPISSPMISLTIPSSVASPTTAKAEGFLTDLGAQVEMQGGLIHDHIVRLGELSPALFKRYDSDIGELFTRSGAVRHKIFSQRYRFKSLEHEAALWHAISDTQMENRELRLQITEERRARLDLAEVVDSMRRGHKPRGDV